MKVIICRGCPSSGKTTFAREYIANHPDYVRINRDDLRTMRTPYWKPKEEELITEWQYQLINVALHMGKNIILDDTNLNSNYLSKLQEHLKDFNVEIEYKDFLDVPLEELIRRDLVRPNSVGADVIRKFYYKYVYKIEPLKQDPTLPHACLIDLDGTLALFGDKNPYDRDFMQDTVNKPVLDMIYAYINENPESSVLFLSGRNSKYRDVTQSWLAQFGLHQMPYMRAIDDSRKDVIVKRELFDTHVRDRYYVDFVVDDRPQVIRLWRSMGLFVFNVGDGREF